MNILPEEKYLEVIRLWKEGYSLRAIERQVGVSKITIQSIAWARNLTRRGRAFGGVGNHRGRNQVKEWAKVRDIPRNSTKGLPIRSEFNYLRAFVIDVRRQLYYRTLRRTHNANTPSQKENADGKGETR